MSTVFRHPMTRAWLVLVAATVVLTALAETPEAGKITSCVVVAIAAFKVRVVFLRFMELDSGAMPWRGIAEIWTVFVAGLIIATYWLV